MIVRFNVKVSRICNDSMIYKAGSKYLLHFTGSSRRRSWGHVNHLPARQLCFSGGNAGSQITVGW